MRDNLLIKKLLSKAGGSIRIFNAPQEFLIKSSTNQEADVVICFVKSRCEIDLVAPIAIKSLREDGVLWFAYPKLKSGIATDINRDHGWEALNEVNYLPVSQVAIDEKWSALRFKQIDRIAKITRKSATRDQKDHSRQIELPIEFENILSKNSRARKFFDSLSYTNRKEYALWISTAKKPETKHKRLESVILKLLAQKKNPSEK